jgi:membrane-associated protease RseP (regulator of RpoE activity)
MRKIAALALTLLFTAAVFADEPVRQKRTFVVRDGKVVHGDASLEAFFIGGPRAYLGVSLINLSPELREHFGAPKDAGVLVESVQQGSPADKASVRVGDIVLSVDGKDVKSSADLRQALRDKKDGESVRMEVLRGRTRHAIVASVKERETPRLLQLDELPGMVGGPEWSARIERMGGDCGDLQTRIRELENRLKDLEKKLQK